MSEKIEPIFAHGFCGNEDFGDKVRCRSQCNKCRDISDLIGETKNLEIENRDLRDRVSYLSSMLNTIRGMIENLT